jgi:hypothetical protein
MRSVVSSILVLACLLLLSCIPAGAQTPVTLPVIPGGEAGYFSISSVPQGGEVVFDGNYWGEAPVTVTVSTTGNPQHTIKVTYPGYETYDSTYTGNPGAGQTIYITATLVPSGNSGQIQVTSTPSGATAVLDRSQSMTTPAYFTNVPVGSHEISVYLSGYQTYYTTVSVNKGQTTYVTMQFTPPVTTGALSIQSTPTGAAVTVDGGYQGITPTVVGNLVPGSHTVILSKAGYQDWISTQSVASGQTTYVTATLATDPNPIYGTVSITSTPTGASVYADGVYVGMTSPSGPLVFTKVTPGVHTLLVSKSGYQDYTGTGTVVAGQNYVLNVPLSPNPQTPTTGSISAASSPTGAEMYLDNVFKGLTPITLDSITPGTHSVLIKLSGYQDFSSQVQVTAGQTSQITATLIPVATPTPTPTATGAAFPLVVLGALAAVVFLAGRKGKNH